MRYMTLFAFLTRYANISRVMLMLLLWKPHLENFSGIGGYYQVNISTCIQITILSLTFLSFWSSFIVEFSYGPTSSAIIKIFKFPCTQYFQLLALETLRGVSLTILSKKHCQEQNQGFNFSQKNNFPPNLSSKHRNFLISSPGLVTGVFSGLFFMEMQLLQTPHCEQEFSSMPLVNPFKTLSSALDMQFKLQPLSLGHRLMASHSNEYTLHFQHLRVSLLNLVLPVHIGEGGCISSSISVCLMGWKKLCYLRPLGCFLLSF